MLWTLTLFLLVAALMIEITSLRKRVKALEYLKVDLYADLYGNNDESAAVLVTLDKRIALEKRLYDKAARIYEKGQQSYQHMIMRKHEKEWLRLQQVRMKLLRAKREEQEERDWKVFCDSDQDGAL